MGRYEELYSRSLEQHDAFWAEEAERLHWYRKWDKVLDKSREPFYRWFTGGMTNVCYNAVDRHALGANRGKAAIIWVSPETNRDRVVTYFELYREVNRLAAVLKRLGIEKGDRVIIYMPMIPSAAVAMLACARLGAIHSVVFAGFSVDALATRISDAKPKLIMTCDAGSRKGRIVPLKGIVDKAVEVATHKVQKVLVLNRKLTPFSLHPGRDLDWNETVDLLDTNYVEPTLVESDHPLYILYTSGTTGQPKGVVRDSGGHMTALHTSMRLIYGCTPDDIFWSTSDIGWTVGHSYNIYGPLLLGMTSVLYEGSPDFPNPGIWWEVVERYGVNVMFSAPTAMRMLRKFPATWIKARDLKTLRYLFLAGEPLDEATWHWTSETLGVPIIDHYWQTESGWPMISNVPGVELLPIKPGSPTRPVMSWKLDVVNEKGEPVAPGTKGYLVGYPPLPPGTFLTLYGDDERYEQAYWKHYPDKLLFHTGDYAIKDQDGYFWVLGRADEVINVAGHRLGTREVEEVVSAHPSVAESSAIGVADALKGQAIAAFVVLKDGVPRNDETRTDILKAVRNKIGAFAMPRDLWFVKTLPKTRSGKVMRRVLKSLTEDTKLGDLSTIEDGVSVDEIKKALQGMEMEKQ
jgi:propionyl-CoA synthetase